MASNTLDTGARDAATPTEHQPMEERIAAESAQPSAREAGEPEGPRDPTAPGAAEDLAQDQARAADGQPDTASLPAPPEAAPADGAAPAAEEAQGALLSPASEPSEAGAAPPVVAMVKKPDPGAATPIEAPPIEAPPAPPHDDLTALRAENERLRTELGAIRIRAEVQRAPRQTRRVIVNTLVVLSCLCLLFSTVTVWAQQTFLSNNERWAEIVGPIGENPAVINALSAYAADQAVTLLQVQQRAQTALPQQAQFLAVPLTSVVRNFAQTQVANVMRSGQFQQAWIKINEAAHTQIVAALRGQSQALTISNNTLTLDLTPIIAQGLQIVSQQLSGVLPPQVQIPDLSGNAQSVQQGIQKLSQALGIPLPSNFGQIELLQSDQLATAQRAVTLLDAFSILLPLVTLLLIVLTLWLSRDRRRTLIQLGIGIVIVFLLAKIGIAYLEQMTLSSITNPTAKDIAQPVMDQALSYIRTSTTWIVVIGALVALGAFLAGKPEWFKAGYAELRKGYAWTQGQARRLRGQLQHAV